MLNAEKNSFSDRELTILRCLCERRAGGRERPTAEITEISFTTGIRDSDEVLRALYTLEGKSLVEPEPRGDFTSHQWQITDVGLRALEFMQS
jgi:hypothetical protein